MLVPSDPGALVDVDAALSTRDWHVVERVDDPHEALVEVCLGIRASVTRAAWGLDRSEPPALVIVAPEQCAPLDDLIAAVDRYLPTVCIMGFENGEIRTLRSPVMTAPSAAAPVAPVPTTVVARTNAPALRLADAITEGSPERTTDDEDEPVGAVPELSAEEIRMLREPAPEEPRR